MLEEWVAPLDYQLFRRKIQTHISKFSLDTIQDPTFLSELLRSAFYITIFDGKDFLPKEDKSPHLALATVLGHLSLLIDGVVCGMLLRKPSLYTYNPTWKNRNKLSKN